MKDPNGLHNVVREHGTVPHSAIMGQSSSVLDSAVERVNESEITVIKSDPEWEDCFDAWEEDLRDERAKFELF